MTPVVVSKVKLSIPVPESWSVSKAALQSEKVICNWTLHVLAAVPLPAAKNDPEVHESGRDAKKMSLSKGTETASLKSPDT
jgi:hypothetical protein